MVENGINKKKKKNFPNAKYLSRPTSRPTSPSHSFLFPCSTPSPSPSRPRHSHSFTSVLFFLPRILALSVILQNLHKCFSMTHFLLSTWSYDHVESPHHCHQTQVYYYRPISNSHFHSGRHRCRRENSNNRCGKKRLRCFGY